MPTRTSSTPTTPDGRHPGGRPRDPHVERAILDAARELLADDGVGGLTIEAVAAHAGVAKTTVYRRYSSRNDVALAVVIDMIEDAPPANLGDTRKEFMALVSTAIRLLSSTLMGRVMQGLVSDLATDPELAAAFRERVLSVRADAVRQLVAQAVERGDLPPGTDSSLAHELLISPIYYRLLLSGAPLDRKLATRIVDTTLAALRARETTPGATAR
jgi:AcrR family transcriptional regulator